MTLSGARRIVSFPINQSVVIFQLLRFEKPIAAGIITLIGVYLGSNISTVLSSPALRAALAICMIDAFSFAVNDLNDAVADKVNSPKRPIPSGRISKQAVVVIAILLGAGGLAVAATLGTKLFLFALLLVTASIIYSYWLKGTVLLGNALIAIMIASILIYGAMVGGEVTSGVLMALGLTFFFIFSQEILVTIRDENGDRTAGVKTIAVLFGGSRSLVVFRTIALLAAGLSILPPLLGLASAPYFVAAIAFVVLPIITMVWLTRSHSNEAICKAIVTMRYISMLSLIPILLLR
ncbi:MAG: hypothetical protein EXR59_02780 [Dehalococcoidia bacterium]|nr:hypothetical protein [Dehalococcoidia bacterium]